MVKIFKEGSFMFKGQARKEYGKNLNQGRCLKLKFTIEVDEKWVGYKKIYK